jgi:peptidoglycan/LPS O-acetylase OafA/YrhL
VLFLAGACSYSQSVDESAVQPATPPVGRRLRSLDGLRGIAALVVVIHHTMLTTPSLSRVYFRDGPVAQRWSLVWWVSWTPIHLFWAGGEAVIVFFLLSGFVLVLPNFGLHAPGWNAYYGKRLVRIYVPVVVAVTVAVMLIRLIHRTPGPSTSTWLGLHSAKISVSQTFRDLALVLDSPGGAFTALWSLRWEMCFSLLLPAFVFCCVVARQRPAIVAGLCAGSIGVSAKIDPALAYMPIFMVGCLLADGYAHEAEWWQKLARCTRRRSGIWSLASLLLLAARWLPVSHLQDGSAVTEGALRLSVVLGAAGLLVVALAGRTARNFLEIRPLQWLGSRSFSLYLVHEPIVVTIAFAFGPRLALGWFLPMMVIVCLAAADAFYRAVEAPAIALARRCHAAVKSSPVQVA